MTPSRPGAFWIARFLPARQTRQHARPIAPDMLFLQWLAFAGVLLFAAFLLWQRNVWHMLIDADPTGITLLIIAVFTSSTVWCGLRASRLADERKALDDFIASFRTNGHAPAPLRESVDDGWTITYLRDLLRKRHAGDSDHSQLTDILAERLHGPTETAWWVNGIQIKLGLLGKVIGFSILAMQIAQIDNFDPGQAQNLLKTLTGGLGIALLTTAVGLLANILLGLQLVRIDRSADTILADALQFAETGLMPASRPVP